MNTQTIIAVLVCLLLPACGKTDAKKNNSKRISDLVEHFKASGLDVGERSEKLAPFISASDGTGLKIAGKEIEFYKFDLDVPVQKAALDKYSREGVEMMGKNFPIVTNGSFALFVMEDHPKWSQIREAFVSF